MPLRTEFEGAVKTEKVVDTQKGNDKDGDKPEERINPDSQEADVEEGDHFEGPGFNDMDTELRKRAKEVYHKLKATITVIPLSFPERGEQVVATAVSNDVRSDSHLAAHDTTGIYKGRNGVAYGVKGASGSLSLIHAVGPPREAIKLSLPMEYRNRGGFKWMVVDDCWDLPDASLACAPLKKESFKGDKGKGKGKSNKGPWEIASRVLNNALRHGNYPSITYQVGGWVDCYSALAVVDKELRKQFAPPVVVRIATVHWLFGMVNDKTDPMLKSRFQLAGVVDNNGTLVEISYVRCKSGHSEGVAGLIPDDTIYTRITEKHLKHISCICHKTRLDNVKNIFSLGLIPGGIGSRSDRAHINFTPFPHSTTGTWPRAGLRVSTTWCSSPSLK